MANAVAQAYNWGLGDVPPVGSRGRAPGQRVWGRSAPEAKHNYTIHKPIFAEFWYTIYSRPIMSITLQRYL